MGDDHDASTAASYMRLGITVEAAYGLWSPPGRSIVLTTAYCLEHLQRRSGTFILLCIVNRAGTPQGRRRAAMHQEPFA
jgi:hypothetical protein